MEIEVNGFDWDEANLKKLRKHKVSQEEAEEIFYSSPLIDRGAYEKQGEVRLRCLGITSTERYLAAFFTLRRNLIRNISVRSMRKKERMLYDKKKRRA